MQKILVIEGCTAVGKSAFALELSKFLKMEIISADSIQVYKGINIATSKPTKKELEICPHHLVDIVSPFETFNAYNFVTLAKNAIINIAQKGKLPVIVGGTGLYIDSLLYGFDFKTDNKTTNYDSNLILLNDDRQVIYNKINIRVDKMISEGLVSEVKALRKIGVNEKCQCMQAIGYKEIYDYLDGKYKLDEAIKLIKKNTRNYAKRQLTWFRHNGAKEWQVKDKEKLIKYLVETCSEYKK